MSNEASHSSAAPAATDGRALATAAATVTGAASTQIGITVNGEPVRLAACSTLADLMASLNRTGRGVAVAVNREVVPRRMWTERALTVDDRVDVVNAIGGG